MYIYIHSEIKEIMVCHNLRESWKIAGMHQKMIKCNYIVHIGICFFRVWLGKERIVFFGPFAHCISREQTTFIFAQGWLVTLIGKPAESKYQLFPHVL